MTLENCSQKLLDTIHLNPANTNASQLTTLARGAEKSDCVSKMGGFSKITTFIEQNSEHGAPNREKACDARLVEQYNINRSLKSNLSKLTSTAWGAQKTECLKEMGGYSQISVFLSNVDKYGSERPNSLKNTQSSSEQTTPVIPSQNTQKEEKNQTSSVVSGQNQASDHGQMIQNLKTQYLTGETAKIVDQGLETMHQVGQWIGYGFLVILAIILLTWIGRVFMRYIYSFLNTSRMIYLKVMLPKTDGKTDREQEKEIAKDMKEKVSRMSQLYSGLHKISDLSTKESMMHKIFGKQKLVMIYQYEQGQLSFIIGTYPEYQGIVESAISAQFANCSLERVKKPNPFQKKYSDIMPLEPEKDPVYTIKTFKQVPDDPINNVIDTMSKVSIYDTVTAILVIKPEDSSYNAKRQKAADRLYKNLSLYETTLWSRSTWLNPFKLLSVIFMGRTGKLVANQKEEANVTMVRMVKAKEEALNTIGEEAGNPIYKSGLLIVSSSDVKGQAKQNLKAMESAYNVYTDEYANRLSDDNTKHDMFPWIFQPLWRIGVGYYLTGFFYKYSYFSTNELSSLYHFPDSIYNRSPIIEWMQYKVLPAPANLPQFSDDERNGKVMTGILAEKFKDGKLSDILKDYTNHRAVTSREIEEEKLTPFAEYQSTHQGTLTELDGKKYYNGLEVITKGEEQFVREIIDKKTVYGYKLYKNAVLLGTNIYRNQLSPVYMKREDRTRHHYMIGKSGTWKSVFLQTIARQDLWNGDGICLIDPHGDLAEDVLSFVPKERAKDVVYFDAGNEDRPMGLNLYEINSLDEADRTVNDATEIFLKMFGPEIFGPRIQEYFKYGSLTILEDFEDRPTLLDVVRLFTDEAYREVKVAKVTNAVVRNRRERTYNAMGDREKAEIIPYFSSKFVSFNTNRLIRNIIGQTKSAFNFDDVMNNQKILLVNLSKGKIWEMNAQLLGMILVSKIYNSAMGRAKLDPKDRKDFYLYVDEFQNFVSGTFADILSEARKYRLGLIMAHQYIAQLETGKGNGEGGKSDVKAAVFGNVGTMMSFKIGAPDAEFMEKEYAPLLGPQDIVGIANYKSYIKLNIDNATSKVFSMNSIYTKDYQNKKIAPLLMEYSSKKYGRAREFVDAEISNRLWVGSDIGVDDLPSTPDSSTASE